MYSCVDDDTQIVNRSLLIRFHDDDIIANTTIDVSAENMVVIVTKADNSQRMWVWFEVGANTQSTEVRGHVRIDNNVVCLFVCLFVYRRSCF